MNRVLDQVQRPDVARSLQSEVRDAGIIIIGGEGEPSGGGDGDRYCLACVESPGSDSEALPPRSLSGVLEPQGKSELVGGWGHNSDIPGSSSQEGIQADHSYGGRSGSR